MKNLTCREHEPILKKKNENNFFLLFAKNVSRNFHHHVSSFAVHRKSRTNLEQEEKWFNIIKIYLKGMPFFVILKFWVSFFFFSSVPLLYFCCCLCVLCCWGPQNIFFSCSEKKKRKFLSFFNHFLNKKKKVLLLFAVRVVVVCCCLVREL